MSEETTKPSPIRRFTDSKTLKNYAGAIAILLGALPAVGSLAVSVVTAYRGEPVAQKTWTTVRDQLNHQAEAINKLHLRVVQFQAHEEGRTAATLQLKLDDLQKKYDQLRASKTISSSTVHPRPSSACKEGYIRIQDRCQRVAKAVAERMKAEEKKSESMLQRLKEEKLRRMKEEKLRQRAEQRVQSNKTQMEKPLLRPLPKMLDDAAKGK